MKKGFLFLTLAAAMLLSACVLQTLGVNVGILGSWVETTVTHPDGSTARSKGAGTFLAQVDVKGLSAAMTWSETDDSGNPVEGSMVTGVNELSIDNTEAVKELLQVAQELGGQAIQWQSGATTINTAANALKTALDAWKADPEGKIGFSDEALEEIEKMIQDALARVPSLPTAPTPTP